MIGGAGMMPARGEVTPVKDIAVAEPTVREILNELRSEALAQLLAACNSLENVNSDQNAWEDAYVEADMATERLRLANDINNAAGL